jgi:hypothetical protein
MQDKKPKVAGLRTPLKVNQLLVNFGIGLLIQVKH